MFYCSYNQNIFSNNYGKKIILNVWCHKQSIDLEKNDDGVDHIIINK